MVPREEIEISDSGSLFAKALRSYQTGGITYSDFLGHVNRYLAAGESPADLLKVLKRRQLIEPLPDYAHDALARLLSASPVASTEEIARAPATVAPPANTTIAAPTAMRAMAAVESIATPQTAKPLPATPLPAAPLPAAPKQAAQPALTEPRSVAAPASLASPPAAPLLAEPWPRPTAPLAAAPQPTAPQPATPKQAAQPALAEPRSVAAPAALAPQPAAPQPAAPQPAAPMPTRSPAALKPAYRPVIAEPLPLAAVKSTAAPMPASSPGSVGAPNPIAAKRAELEPPPVIRRDGTAPTLDEPLAVSASRLTKPDFLKSPWGSERRSPWTRSAFWLGAAAIAAAVAWIYSRAPETTHPGPAVGVITPTPTPTAEQRPAATAPAAAVSSAPGTIIRDCPTCPQMTVVRVGRFKQGSAYDDRVALPSEKPQHIVLMRQPFAMSTTELTVANFREFVAATKWESRGCEVYDGEWHHKPDAYWNDPGFPQSAEYPVTCISWNDAVAYADWLSKKTGHRYRLPSASEWEYAARSGSDASLPWGASGQGACKNANVADRSAARRYPKWSVFACNDGYVNTAPVGSFKANAFGIDDMLGNVLEWTKDCWHDDYSKAPIDGSARMDGDCSEHELRGGSWFSSAAFVRPAYRNHAATDYRSSSIGVRLVREMTP